MIRKLQETDIDRIAEIWLNTNMKAHNFISSKYWEDNFERVKEIFPKAEVYVYEDENKGKIQGFIGMSDNYIEGIFVWSDAQSCGIGKQLLDFVKTIKKQLTLSVYQKNIRAVRFYKSSNFNVQCEKMDENTGEKEYVMVWEQ
ncbi:GNAT family N-acetyltransferase [Anaeromicropila herbilytica]|uniref:Acetyltransferase n=1 Tax=Anaeromicropila herbilytica TaxID=2785025 RepID=A0A7R7ELK9_9FIRM|nr:GNAT family N-acetyltransferase [Anaeromicropila herbilytica]BCN30856.1 acetyltransferase [Anaeromicropila herbilytica]